MWEEQGRVPPPHLLPQRETLSWARCCVRPLLWRRTWSSPPPYHYCLPYPSIIYFSFLYLFAPRSLPAPSFFLRGGSEVFISGRWGRKGHHINSTAARRSGTKNVSIYTYTYEAEPRFDRAHLYISKNLYGFITQIYPLSCFCFCTHTRTAKSIITQVFSVMDFLVLLQWEGRREGGGERCLLLLL